MIQFADNLKAASLILAIADASGLHYNHAAASPKARQEATGEAYMMIRSALADLNLVALDDEEDAGEATWNAALADVDRFDTVGSLLLAAAAILGGVAMAASMDGEGGDLLRKVTKAEDLARSAAASRFNMKDATIAAIIGAAEAEVRCTS